MEAASELALLEGAFATIRVVLESHERRIAALETRSKVGQADLRELRRALRPEWGKKGAGKLAAACGLCLKTVNQIELGKVANPERGTLLKIASGLGCGEREVVSAWQETRRRVQSAEFRV